MAYTGALSATYRYMISSEAYTEERWSSIRAAAVIGSVASLVLMHVPFCLYQPLVQGVGLSELTTLSLFKVICFALVLRGMWLRIGKKKSIGFSSKNASLLAVPLILF